LRGTLIIGRAHGDFLAVRTATTKYVRYGGGFEELYDLSTDPYELDNKAGSP
jgi:hypothetical protein